MLNNVRARNQTYDVRCREISPLCCGFNPTPPAFPCIDLHFAEFEKRLTEGRVRRVTAKGYRKMIWVLSKIGDRR